MPSVHRCFSCQLGLPVSTFWLRHLSHLYICAGKFWSTWRQHLCRSVMWSSTPSLQVICVQGRELIQSDKNDCSPLDIVCHPLLLFGSLCIVLYFTSLWPFYIIDSVVTCNEQLQCSVQRSCLVAMIKQITLSSLKLLLIIKSPNL